MTAGSPSMVRLALAALPYPSSREASVDMAVRAVHEAGAQAARLVAFPECFVPGYRWPTRVVPAPDAAFLEDAWATIAAAARDAGIMVVLGTERLTDRGVHLTALVIEADGTIAGFQDKVQLDPSEDGLYIPAEERRLFSVDGVPFGIVICHEGFRYPETVRWAARRGARFVLHPHYSEAEPGTWRPTSYGEPRNSFHEQAARCRAAENAIWYATINCAEPGAPTTTAVIAPDGEVHAWQPYGQAGLLVADLDLSRATGLLASRCRTTA